MTKNIAVLPGDGIGPEVIKQGMKVLDAIAERYGHSFKYTHASVGATAIDKFGDPLPKTTSDICYSSDAILFGAIGDPKYDNDPSAKVRPEQGLLKLRKMMGLFCNMRPVKTFKNLLHLSPLKAELVKDVDFVIYRELTGGIYFGEKGTSEDGQTAFDQMIYSVEEIDRMAHLAFKAAMNRRKKLTLVDKANVLESSRLWRSRVRDLASQYPEVNVDYMFVDNAAMQLVQNPGGFDVLLTGNMFGDILSDEASVLQGSLGMLPSASVGKHAALFEPIHGSYPQVAGKDIANPMATVLSVAMMLDYFEMRKEARSVRRAISICLEHDIGTIDLGTGIKLSCSQVGDLLASLISDGMEALNMDRLKESNSTII